MPWNSQIFNKDFDRPKTPEPKPAPVPAEPVYSAADLQRVRAEALRDGHASGLAEADGVAAALARHALLTIAESLDSARAEAAAIAKNAAEAVACVLMDAFAAAFPALCSRHAEAELRAIVRAVLPCLHDEPAITVRASPHVTDALTQEIAAIDPDLLDRVRIVPADAVPEGDARSPRHICLPALWIEPELKEEALFRGCTVVDPPSVLTTHITELVRENVAELLSHAETQKLLDELPREQRKLVDDLIPSQITVGGVQRVLQTLLAERVSVRDLSTILEGVQEACGAAVRSVPAIVAHVRIRLARQISDSHVGPQGFLPLITLSPEWETAFLEALTGPPEDRQLAMAPSKLQTFMQSLRTTFDTAAAAGEAPVLLTSGGIRGHVRAIVERFRPGTPVLSQMEIFPKVRIRTVATI